MTSKNAEIAGSPFDRSFRLHIGQFDVGFQRITTCTVALKLHLSHHPQSLPAFRDARMAVNQYSSQRLDGVRELEFIIDLLDRAP